MLGDRFGDGEVVGWQSRLDDKALAVNEVRADPAAVVSLEKSSDGEVDNKPKGPSVGDTWQGAGNIAESGSVIGRLQVTTTLVDSKYHSGFHIGVMILPDGTITYQGSGIGKKIPGIPATVDTNVYAITGGTAVYAGAGGSITA